MSEDVQRCATHHVRVEDCPECWQDTPNWLTVAPLIARWQIALVPRSDGTWDVLACFPQAGPPVHEAARVPWPDVPKAIADIAAQCAADDPDAAACLPCGHPATAYVDRPGYGWCSLCAQQAEAALEHGGGEA